MCLDVLYEGRREVDFPQLYFELEKFLISCPLFNWEAEVEGGFLISLLENNRFFSPPCRWTLNTETGLKDPLGVVI